MIKKLRIKKEINTPKTRENPVSSPHFDTLSQRISEYLQIARQCIRQSVDTEMVKAYWLIGKDIVEEEQRGKVRANYGENIMQELSARLTQNFGEGYSIVTLKNIKQFYLSYSEGNQKSSALRSFSSKLPSFQPKLSWTHYRLLMRVRQPEARAFYEIEAMQNQWSSRELERQINSDPAGHLNYPDLPLHNNLSERDIQEYIKKRKISGSARSDDGRRCRDTFASLRKTCLKLKVNFWDYLIDRHTKTFAIPPLSHLIHQAAAP